MSEIKGPTSYSPRIDRYSQEIIEKAIDVAKDRSLTPAQRQNCIQELEQQLVDRLETDFKAGHIGRNQFDGGIHRLAGPGGEMGEIRRATELAVDLLSRPNAAARLRRVPSMFTSDIFHNATMTGEASDGRMVHVRFGTHGGLELRDREPTADGFPFPGSKWVEGDIVVGDKIYSFVDEYTDNFKIQLDDSGNPTAMLFKGEVDVKAFAPEILQAGSDKWSAGMPATQSKGRALIEMTIPLTSNPGKTELYGALDIGFSDKNFALSATGGSIVIRPLDDNRTVASEEIQLSEAAGAMEEGQYRNVPSALPPAYSYVQGQRLDLVGLLDHALTSSPEDLLPLYPRGKLQRELRSVMAGATPSADLATQLNADLLARAKRDPALRRLAAPILIRHLANAGLPKPGEQTTSTQFAGRLLSESLAGKLVSTIVGRAIDEAGSLDASGAFTSYEEGLVDLLTKNRDFVDPVAVLNVNHVTMWRITPEGTKQSLLERRTNLLFDEKAATFLIGFQEVFHE